MDNRIISEIVQKVNEFEKVEFTTDILCKKRTEIINIIKRFMEKVTAENLSEHETLYMLGPLRYIIDKRYCKRGDALDEEMFELTDISDMPECKTEEEKMQRIEFRLVRLKNLFSEDKFFVKVVCLLSLPDATQRIFDKLEEVVYKMEESNEKDNNIWTDNDIEGDFIVELGCTRETVLRFEKLMEEVFPEFDEFLGR